MRHNTLPILALATLFLAGIAAPVFSQSLSDGVFMPKRTLCAGVLATQDKWDHYWEGTRLRTNGNIGTVTTQMIGAMAAYGITDRLNVVTSLPFVHTQASGGTLAPQRGLQDLTLGLKWKAFQRHLGKSTVSLGLAAGGSIPTNNYVADYLPLSIGMHCKTAFGRGILHLETPKHLSFTVQGTYTSRSNVQLDRNTYYTTTEQFVESNQVVMPAVLNYSVRAGYHAYRAAAELVYERNECTAGGDIRRQDMPFLSNRMESTRVGLMAHYRVPFLADLQVVGQGFYTLSGRNVGQSTAVTLGLMKVFGYKPSAEN